MQQSLFASVVAQTESTETAPEGQLDIALSQAVFNVIDVETTGLNAKRNALTEITVIQYQDGVEKAKFSTLVKPTEEIPPEVETLTGITNEMVQQAPPLITVLSDLCAFVGPSPLLVGHNVPFDIKFVSEKIQQVGLASFLDRFDINKAFCTRVLAVKTLPGLPSYEGITVATQCGVYNPNPHRAESDVRMSAGILFALIDKIRNQGIALQTVQDLLTYQGSLNPN